MRIIRIEQFNAAHRLHNPSFSDAENLRVFGKCNNPNFHGHNYRIEVMVDGPIDSQTGYVYDMKLLSDLIKSEIVERFDHRNLNLDCPEFSQLNPTAENIAVVCWNILREKLSSHLGLSIKLWETERNCVEYSGEEKA